MFGPERRRRVFGKWFGIGDRRRIDRRRIDGIGVDERLIGELGLGDLHVGELDDDVDDDVE